MCQSASLYAQPTQVAVTVSGESPREVRPFGSNDYYTFTARGGMNGGYQRGFIRVNDANGKRRTVSGEADLRGSRVFYSDGANFGLV